MQAPCPEKHLMCADAREEGAGRVNQITLFERGQVDIEADLKVSPGLQAGPRLQLHRGLLNPKP